MDLSSHAQAAPILGSSDSEPHASITQHHERKKKKAFILHWEDLTWLSETLKGCRHFHIALVKTPRMVDTLAPLFTTLVVIRVTNCTKEAPTEVVIVERGAF